MQLQENYFLKPIAWTSSKLKEIKQTFSEIRKRYLGKVADEKQYPSERRSLYELWTSQGSESMNNVNKRLMGTYSGFTNFIINEQRGQNESKILA